MFSASGPARWAQLRAAVLAYFIFFNVVAALPTLGRASAERLQRPFERQELARWVALFRSFGIDTNAGEVGRLYLDLAGAIARTRAALIRPIEPWQELTQTRQGWTLFSAPDESVSVLQVSAFAGERERVLYQSGHPEHGYAAALVEYRRIRAAYNPKRSGPPPTYAGFAARLGERIFRDLPEVDRVRVALAERRVALPGEAHDSSLTESHVLVFTRPAR